MYEAKKKRNAWLGIDGISWDGITGVEPKFLSWQAAVSFRNITYHLVSRP